MSERLVVSTSVPRTSTVPWVQYRPAMTLETLILCCSVLLTLAYNLSFWRAALVQPLTQWRLAMSLFVLVTALHSLLMGLVLTRWNAKPVLTLLLLVTAMASHYMNVYGVYLDADMVRNVLHTDSRESLELLTPDLLLPMLSLGVPIALLWKVQLRRRSLLQGAASRALFLFAALLVASVGLWASFQAISSLVRNHREVRYLVTPANYLVSLTSVLLQSPPGPRRALSPVGVDAVQRGRPAGAKPRLLVLVVGETARARNWGLNGYVRQTTPELARIKEVVNFTDVDACGSSTEVSLPCMFSRYGRRHYDAAAISSHQSLLHVLDQAGIPVLWRDNQSGCKGVCDGLETQRLHDAEDPAFCNGQRCLDEILLRGLLRSIQPGPGDRVVVLHQLGNHGPSYSERYPRQFAHYLPACNTAELDHCPRQQIVNAYDNALRYTDHVLASTIRLLQSQDHYDAAMIYVSDHGESLGENGLYLHGVPYPIAPEEQLKVPMVMWFSPSFARAAELDLACLARQAGRPTSHDALFPSVLGLMQVATSEYRAEGDLFAACRHEREPRSGSRQVSRSSSRVRPASRRVKDLGA